VILLAFSKLAKRGWWQLEQSTKKKLRRSLQGLDTPAVL